MPVAYTSIGSYAASAGATTLTPGLPTLDPSGGALLAVCVTKNNATHSTATAGWTKLKQVNSGASFTASLWIAARTAAAPVFTWAGSVACSAQVAYYNSVTGPLLVGTLTSGADGTGTTSPHNSGSFNSTINNALAVYIDLAAANTAFTNPAGWTSNSGAGSATSATRHSFGSKTIPTSGTASGAISSAGAAAAWVQFQVQMQETVSVGLESSKIETGPWLDPPAGADSSKFEVGPWFDPVSGAASSKFEVGPWFDPVSGLASSKMEVAAWLEPGSLPSGGDEGYVMMIC